VVSWPTAFLLAALAASQARGSDLDTISAAVDRGEFAAAARQAGSFVRLHPESTAARILLARACMGLNDGAGALQELREALRRDADSMDALYYLSKLTAILSQQEFAAVAQIAPESARMHQIKAEMLEAQGNAAGAEWEYLAALEKRPGSSSVLNALGDLKRREKQWSAALGWYEKVLGSDPSDYDALYGAGVCRRASQSTEEALILFRRALKVEPSSVAAKMAVGESLLIMGNAKDALPLLEQAAKADPRLRRLQFLLARAYRSLGRNEDAQRAFERARELPEQPGETEEGK
jgi:Tfp pilus assembly protein PilF